MDPNTYDGLLRNAALDAAHAYRLACAVREAAYVAHNRPAFDAADRAVKAALDTINSLRYAD
jgi:hypothetical protein